MLGIRCTREFDDVWVFNQGVQNVNWFLRVFRERITDCWSQGWDGRIHERDRYSIYRIFKLQRDRHSVYRIFELERDRYSVYRIFKLERDRHSVYRIFKLERDRHSVYRIFKLEQSLEPCFYCVTNKALRDVFIRFRMGIS